MEKKLSKNKLRKQKRYGNQKNKKVYRGELGVILAPPGIPKKLGKAKKKAIAKIIASMSASGNTTTTKVKRVRK